jgi:hypothetical protein
VDDRSRMGFTAGLPDVESTEFCKAITLSKVG